MYVKTSFLFVFFLLQCATSPKLMWRFCTSNTLGIIILKAGIPVSELLSRAAHDLAAQPDNQNDIDTSVSVLRCCCCVPEWLNMWIISFLKLAAQLPAHLLLLFILLKFSLGENLSGRS